MKVFILALVTLLTTVVQADKPLPIQPVKIDISKRVPLNLDDVRMVRTYAESHSYYFAPNLKEGMRVLFSASYGIGGEAAQAAGTVIRKDGKFYFKQISNPSSNLLLAPGLPIRSSSKVSLWDLGAYMDLINRVIFSEPNKTSHTANHIYVNAPEAALVNFRGGTAGKWVDYEDALEVKMSLSVGNRSKSDLKVYYAKGIGPVALEFRENMSPAGTFKFYMGE